MTEKEFIIYLVAYVVPIIISGFIFHWFASRRQKYNRQIEGYFELRDIMENIYSLIIKTACYLSETSNANEIEHGILKRLEHPRIHNFRLKIQEFNKELKKYIDDKDGFRDKFRKWELFLHQDLKNSFKEFIDSVDYLEVDQISIAKEKVYKVAQKIYGRKLLKGS